MSIHLSLGVELSIALGSPSSYSIAGFESMDYDEVGEVGDLPAFGGEAEVREYSKIGSGVVSKRAGTINYGSVPITVARIVGDAGQIALVRGFDGLNKGLTHSIKIHHPEIGALYFSGVITAYKFIHGDADSVNRAQFTFAISGRVLATFDPPDPGPGPGPAQTVFIAESGQILLSEDGKILIPEVSAGASQPTAEYSFSPVQVV